MQPLQPQPPQTQLPQLPQQTQQTQIPQQTQEAGTLAEDLIFCFAQQSSDALVMLYPPEKIAEKMLKPIDPPHVLWIAQGIPEQLKAKVDEIKKEFGGKIIAFMNAAQVGEFLLEKNELKNSTIVCQPGLLKEVKLLNRRKQISTVIQYPAFGEEDLSESQQETQDLFVFQAENDERLLKLIENSCRIKPDYKDFLNFVALKDIIIQDTLVRTIMVLIIQPIDQHTRRQIIGWFQKLSKKLQSQHKLQKFIEELMQGPLPPKRAFYWYTHEIGIYKIINNLLRSCSHPSELFYLQPIFKDLFSAIQTLLKQTKKEEGFVCYRGGYIQKSQIEDLQKNIGGIVKNLSFLSTSQFQETALEFKRNIVFEITVPASEEEIASQSTFSYGGYAKIKQASYFFGEQQILFNPLCSFKVLEIKEIQGKHDYTIRLLYRRSTNQDKPRKNSLSKQQVESEKKLSYFAKLWKKLENQIRFQGSALTFFNQSLKNGSDYWKKYLEVTHTFQFKIYGFLQLCRAQEFRGIQFQKIHKQMMEICKEKYGSFAFQNILQKITSLNKLQINNYFQIVQAETKLQLRSGEYLKIKQTWTKLIKFIDKNGRLYTEILWILSTSYQYLGQYQKSVELIKEATQILNHTEEYDITQIVFFIQLADRYRRIRKYEQALKLCEKCQRLYLEVVAETHQCYIHSLHIMACVFIDSGQPKKAKQLLEKCCRLTRKNLGENNVYYVEILKNLAAAQQNLGNYQQARRWGQISLKICEDYYLESQQFLIVYIECLNKFSQILNNQSLYKEALKIIRKSCELSAKVFGQNHPVSLKSRAELGDTLLRLNKLKQAEEVMVKCYKSQQSVLGEHSQHPLKSLSILGKVYRGRGKFQMALRTFETCLHFASKTIGQNNLLCLGLRNNYGLALLQMKQYTLAAIQFEKSYNLAIQQLGQNNSAAIDSLGLLGMALLRQKKTIKAREIYQKCFSLGRELFGGTSPHFLEIWKIFAQVNLEMGESEKALQIQKQRYQVLI